MIAAAAAACGSPRPAVHPGPPGPVGLTDGGRAVRIEIAGTEITGLGTPAAAQATAEPATDWLWSPIVDSHVHLAFWPVADKLVASGVAAVVDLSAPEAQLAGVLATPGLHVLASGPMLTRDGGYPLASWGKDGYGIPCSDAAAVEAAIARLAGQGAKVIKLALDDKGLAEELVPAAVAAAHARGLKVGVHALSDRSAQVAGRAGVDLLVHTPVEPLADATAALWRGRAVISTLAAFGGKDAAVDNLRRLRAAGATVLYGTDLGNARVAGPNPDELALLRKAGLDDAAIADAMTTAPARYWGLPFGVLPGREATFVVLAGDPRRDASLLLAPRAAWLRGRQVK